MSLLSSQRLRYALLLATVFAASASHAETDWELVTAPTADSPLLENSATNAPAGFMPQALEDFNVGDVRTVGGNQSVVADAIVTEADTPLEFFNLLFGAVELGGAGDEILDASAIAALEQLTPETVATDPIAQIFLPLVFGLSSSAFNDSFSSSFFLSVGVVDSSVGLDLIFLQPSPLADITTGGGVFYALPFDNSGNFDVLVDGFVIDPALNNSVSVALGINNATLSELNQATSITGACATGCTLATSSASSLLNGGNSAPHGVSWGLVLPPFEFTTTTEQAENGNLAFITVNELTPRSELPSTGIATYDTVIGGIGAVRATDNGILTGTLDTFAATVDFATAQVTDVALSGHFNPGETFSAANTGGPSSINVDGSFAAALSGSCSFCNDGISGQMAGGFANEGAALLATYGLRPTNLAGSQQSIVGSVLATE